MLVAASRPLERLLNQFAELLSPLCARLSRCAVGRLAACWDRVVAAARATTANSPLPSEDQITEITVPKTISKHESNLVGRGDPPMHQFRFSHRAVRSGRASTEGRCSRDSRRRGPSKTLSATSFIVWPAW
jgi:hypothetical protein